MLTGAHKTLKIASALTFLEQYHKNGYEFLNYGVRVTGDEIWVSFVNVEAKEQLKSKKFILTMSACQKADGSCFLGQKRRADGGIHATRDRSDVRIVLRNTKSCVWSFKIKDVEC
jgi:hypothetical protein